MQILEAFGIVIGYWLVVGAVCLMAALWIIRADAREASKSDFGEQHED